MINLQYPIILAFALPIVHTSIPIDNIGCIQTIESDEGFLFVVDLVEVESYCLVSEHAHHVEVVQEVQTSILFPYWTKIDEPIKPDAVTQFDFLCYWIITK